MKFMVPYASFGLVETTMKEIADELSIEVEYDIQPNKSRLRNAAPDRKGIPHVVVNFKLRAKKGNDVYRKFSGERRTVGICWHGHKMYMERLFAAFDDATLLTCLAKYYGKESFNKLHYATQHRPFNWRENCQCCYSTTNDEGLTVYFG